MLNLTFEGQDEHGLFGGDVGGFVNDAAALLYSLIIEQTPSQFARVTADLSVGSAGLDLASLETPPVAGTYDQPELLTGASGSGTWAVTGTPTGAGGRVTFLAGLKITGATGDPPVYTYEPYVFFVIDGERYWQWDAGTAPPFPANPLVIDLGTVDAALDGLTLTCSAGAPSGTGRAWGFNVGGGTPVAGVVHQVVAVDLKDNAGNYLPLDFRLRSEIGAVDGPGVRGSGNAMSSGFWVENNVIHLDPPSNDSQTIRVRYIPAYTNMVTTTDVPWEGRFSQFHRLIAYEAALLALDKDEAPLAITRSAKALRDQFAKHIRRTQAGKPRRMRRSDEEDY